MGLENAPIKGAPIRVLVNASKNGLSDVAVDCRGVNAVNVAVFPTGSSPSATVSVEGAEEQGGNYIQLPDPNASQAAVTANKMFDVVVGTGWVKIRLASLSGTFANNQGYTVIVTPYVSPGQTTVNISNIANQNLAQYGGVDVGAGNPLDVEIQGSLPAGSNAVGSVSLNHGIPCWSVTQDSSANAAQTLTRAAEASKKHYLTALEVVISGAAAGADIALSLKDGTTTLWKSYIGNAAARGSRVQVSFPQPLECSTNTAANLEVAAGGASVVTTANLSGYTK